MKTPAQAPPLRGPDPQHLIVQTTGEHPDLARAELEAICEVVRTGAPQEIGPLTFRIKGGEMDGEQIARRGGLVRYVGHLLSEADEPTRLDASTMRPPGTFAVRATVIDGAAPRWEGRAVEREVGGLVKLGRVNLENPGTTFRVFLGTRAHLTHQIYDREDDDLEERQVKHRPYFKPVSLHPKFARVLVNLSRVHDGQLLLDPFCGTGGLLIEAGLMGARLVGIDADPEAAAGAPKNLEHFGILGAQILEGRAKDAFELLGSKVPAIATDPPYGRSATTMKRGPKGVLEESAAGLADVLEPGGHLALCVPDPEMARPFDALLKRKLEIPSRVHASLTRHFMVYESR